MQEIWTRIENWLRENAPPEVEILNPGASPEEIEQTEAFLGVTFPDDVRESYLIHNGQPDGAPGLIHGGLDLLSLAEIKGQWIVWKELLDDGTFHDFESYPHEAIKKVWWNAKWIPLTYDGAGNHHCLDLDPSETGKPGQIITMWHDAAERELLADGFREWLENFADNLDEGIYVYDDEEYYAIVDKTDLL